MTTIAEYKKGLKTPYTGMTKELMNKIEGIEEPKIVLEDMTKDELNDYAASLGFTDDVNTSMKKPEMIKIIKQKVR